MRPGRSRPVDRAPRAAALRAGPRFPRWTGIALALTAAGCGGYGELCEAAMKCRGGNDADTEACAIELDRLEQRSELLECADEWSSLAACVEQDGRCEGDQFSAACDAERTAWEQCSDLELSL